MSRAAVLWILACCFCSALPAAAQQSQTLSVTPPLFQLTVEPGQSWQSSIKIVNANDVPLEIYADPVNFAPQGEAGHGQFLPLFETETDGQTLAEWILVDQDRIVIPPETSYELPFSVVVPSEAAPGGHFAAILVGTSPPDINTDGGPAVRTSQVVSSLLFLRVAGDINEAGSIREFSVGSSFIERPQANFSLRFQNEGNVHLRPQGEILITNMWGRERGVIPINQGSSFGNVLPDSIREFEFSWEGEYSFADIGRYTAEVAISYGTDARQSVSRKLYFWIIPVRAGIGAMVGLAILILLLRWSITSYVRHMLIRAGIDPDEHAAAKRRGDVAMYRRVRTHVRADEPTAETALPVRASASWIVRVWQEYFYFIVGIPAAILLLVSIIWFIAGALKEQRDFSATIERNGESIEINSEELQRSSETSVIPASTTLDTLQSEQDFSLTVINMSDKPGIAAAAADTLEQAGFVVDKVAPDLTETRAVTTIVSDARVATSAQAISATLSNPLVSLRAASTTIPEITVFIGNDFVVSDIVRE